ncbi:hypothetical protein ACIQI8_35635 [Streptomyces sp. NPDC092369]|uniref:hypothetical protein n=1 Tax=Streptomyces sp. NPDC092369 TaxID=3366015 RepID=UPI0038066BB0
MKATHRLPLLVAPSLLALSACGIPATGVVEAGGPASGIASVASVYFVRDGGALVAVPRTTAEPGDAGTALDLLLLGPTDREQSEGLASEVPGMPSVAPVPTSKADAVDGRSDETGDDAPTVTVRDDTLSIELPGGMGRLTGLAIRQLICTAAAAHRVATQSANPVTVDVTSVYGQQTRGSDKGCPDP